MGTENIFQRSHSLMPPIIILPATTSRYPAALQPKLIDSGTSPTLFFGAAAAALVGVTAAAGAPCVLAGLLNQAVISNGPGMSLVPRRIPRFFRPEPERFPAFRTVHAPFAPIKHRRQLRPAQRTPVISLFYFDHNHLCGRRCAIRSSAADVIV